MAMKIEGVSSRDVLIQSEDLTEAAQFYETVLGLRVTHRSETLIGLETGSFCLYVEKGPSYGPVFEFYVSDLAAAKSKLIGAGCRVENEDSTIPRCYVRDPFGLIFNLAERKQSSDQSST
jgi:catechol 2,3-dioxygenase-like lactoylglutathione lyase family enzyme